MFCAFGKLIMHSKEEDGPTEFVEVHNCTAISFQYNNKDKAMNDELYGEDTSSN